MRNLLSLKWAMLIILTLIWGSSFILMKQGLKGFPPEQVAAIRMVIACIASSLFAVRRFKNLKIKRLLLQVITFNALLALVLINHFMVMKSP